MAYSYNKKPASQYVYADVTVWQCSACNCWSRLEFVQSDEPNCPVCNSQMIQQVKNIRVE